MKSFEEKLERLEEISNTIKGGELPLKSASSLFEEGIKLAIQLEKEIETQEKKIEILLNQPQEIEKAPELDLFDENVNAAE